MKQETNVFQKDKLPEGFSENFLFHGKFEAVNQEWVNCECCDAKDPKYGLEAVSKQSLLIIEKECLSFWNDALPHIISSYGRCNWSPLVDTEEHHARSMGSNFYTVRNGSTFFLDGWPSPEKEEIIRISQSFPPCGFVVINGNLEFVKTP